jgi:hypothetical protein
MANFYTGEDDRTAFERLRRTELAKHASANGLNFHPAATKGDLIRLMEGQGMRPPVASVAGPGSRFSSKEDVEAAKAELAEMINTMRPSELRALGKQYGIELNIRMSEDEVAEAKRALVAKM